MDGLNIKETLRLLPTLFKTNLVPCLMGSTGVGKTQLLEQFAKSQKWDLVVLHVAQLEPADFLGPQKALEDNTSTFCRPNWLPTNENANPKGGIIFLDEINRGHEDIRQALYQFLTTKTIHTYQAPAHYHIVAAANPSEEYEVYEFDKALVNRFAWVKFHPNPSETCEYLEGKLGKNPMLSWVNSDRTLLDYGNFFNIENMVFSPRTLESAMLLYSEIKEEGKGFIRKAMSTIMTKEKVSGFMSFLEETETLTFTDILKGDKTKQLDALIKDERADLIANINNDLIKHFSGKTKFSKLEVDNLIKFFDKISVEYLEVFIDSLPDIDKTPASILTEDKFQKYVDKKIKASISEDYLKRINSGG